MSSTARNEFKPDYALHPGVYLEDILDQRGIRKADFALRCGRPAKTISEIIAGKAAIMPDTALQFERVLDVSASLWLAWESDFQLHAARLRQRKDLENESSWIDDFPVQELQDKGLLPRTNDKVMLSEALLVFFGVSSPSAWNGYWQSVIGVPRFKRSPNAKVDQYAIAAWLRAGDIEASKLECEPYNESSFRNALIRARSLSQREWSTVQSELVELFRTCGVALAFVPSLARTGLRGAAYWSTKDKAVIVVGDRLKRASAVWFALFHEAMHVLLHSKKAVFIDSDNAPVDAQAEQEEQEADERAASALISAAQLHGFFAAYGTRRDGYSALQIEEYAQKIEIGPTLLLKRLQRDGFISHKSTLNGAFHDVVKFD